MCTEIKLIINKTLTLGKIPEHDNGYVGGFATLNIFE